MKTFFYQFLIFALTFCWQALPGQNVGLDFDGAGDYITLTPVAGFPTGCNVSNFTVEMSFKSLATGTTSPLNLCDGNFRNLFCLGNPNNNTIFSVGECDGLLSVLWVSTCPTLTFNLSQTTYIRDGLWHCLSVVWSPTSMDLYLDGGTTPDLTAPTNGAMHNISIFSVGHSLALGYPNVPAPGEDWLGRIDEVKLWDNALPAAQLTACNPCVLDGTEPGLVAYWRLDDGIAGQTNSLTSVADCSPFNNDGVLHPHTVTPPDLPGHDLTDPDGNFVAGAPALLYPEYTKLTLEIEDAGPPYSNLTEICSGDPIHVCLRDAAGNVPPPGSPFAPVITWEEIVGGFPQPLPVSYNPYFSTTNFCFNVPPGIVLATNCTSSSPGYEDKIYRATLVVTDPVSGNSCTYYSTTYNLRICCPVPQPTVVLNVQPTGILNGTLCEGDVVTIDVSLTGIPWFPPTGSSVVTIDWCIDDGFILTPISFATGLTQFTLPMTVGPNDFCIRAKIQNCACPLVTAEACIMVDKNPICGSIIGCDPALMPVLSPCPAGMLCYEICPGEDAAVCLDPSTTFLNCIPHWEFSFDNVNWTSPMGGPLGISNPIQQTNTLPCDDVGSPYEWPAGQQCIYYRVLCYPLSQPSGCEPCTTNVIRICLKPAIVPNVVISQNQVCLGGSSQLNVTNPQGSPVTYTWYCNGLVVGGNSPNYTATQEAWYWVEANNGCEVTESNHVFLQVCVVTAEITCPLNPNPCATPGLPIYLSGCGSTSTCGGPLTYAWSVSPSLPPLIINGCNVEHTPPASGATYTLTVTGPGPLFCTATASRTVIPCQ